MLCCPTSESFSRSLSAIRAWARSLDDLEDGVRVEITRSESLKNDDGKGSKRSPPDVRLATPDTKFESR